MRQKSASILSALAIRNAGQVAILLLILHSFGVRYLGLYTLSLAIATPIFIIGGLGLKTLILTRSDSVSNSNFWVFRNTSIIICICIGIIVGFFLSNEIRFLWFVVVAMKTVDLYEDFLSGLYQKENYFRLIPLLSVCLAAGRLGSFFVALLLVESNKIPFVAMALVPGIIIIIAWYRNKEREDIRFAPLTGNTYLSLLSSGISLGGSAAAISLLSTLPQYLLGFSSDVEAAAVFALLLYIQVAIEMILNALSQASIPMIKQARSEKILNATYVYRMILKWTLLSVPLALILVISVFLLMPKLFNSNEIDYFLAIPIFASCVALPSVFATSVTLSVANLYRYSLYSSILTLVLAFVTGLLLLQQGLFDLRSAMYLVMGSVWCRAILNIRFLNVNFGKVNK